MLSFRYKRLKFNENIKTTVDISPCCFGPMVTSRVKNICFLQSVAEETYMLIKTMPMEPLNFFSTVSEWVRTNSDESSS